ncbi:hypothetical protein FHU24_003403 [Clostridium saccharobutylicum]|nr:hypothetical protein [Clostridium saccharobutylicum]MBA8983756.1 hypothetical protein [Clostridium saccharobutylicum]MBA8997671.1 hypothetical protein [Clostridium saccharobutylicum]MBA9009110.1 hypothetical protein [Clostridium saccharobutylicum]NOV54742.1 hypothetical protein [Clostridium saccharobutylicum]
MTRDKKYKVKKKLYELEERLESKLTLLRSIAFRIFV